MSSAQEPREAEADPRIGLLLKGKWTLVRRLGEGGMASVYLATHRNGSKVAIKMLHAHLAAHRDTLRRFLREGYVANKVNHAGVVRVLDDDVAQDGSPFLVMELLDGRSLDVILDDRGRLSVGEAATYGEKILDVLAAAHEAGVVHRDMKPANVFVVRDGSVKVLDFGIARIRELELAGSSFSTSSPGTMGGMVLGTPAFMPPEQARARWSDVDARTDLWAAGATIYMLLTGRSVRDDAGTVNEALMHAMSRPVPPMAALIPDLPSEMAWVLDRALAFEREHRFPTARAMREALEAAHTKLGARANDTVAEARAAALVTGDASPVAVQQREPASVAPPAVPAPEVTRFAVAATLATPASLRQGAVASTPPLVTPVGSAPATLPALPRAPRLRAGLLASAVVAIAGVVGLASVVLGPLPHDLRRAVRASPASGNVDQPALTRPSGTASPPVITAEASATPNGAASAPRSTPSRVATGASSVAPNELAPTAPVASGVVRATPPASLRAKPAPAAPARGAAVPPGDDPLDRGRY